jgi:nicotinamidase-related amidase
MTSTLEAANRQYGFEGRLEPGKVPALLIVDFVKAYTTPGSPLYAPVETARAATAELLDLCRELAVPVIHTKVAYRVGGRDGGIFFRKVPALRCFEEGAHPELAAFAEGLEPRSSEVVITKQYASAFFGTSLASTLAASRIDTLLITGVSTSGCIRATAVDCCQHGFVPLVVRDAVGDRTPALHDANLFDMQAKYAEVMALTGVCEYLRTVHR